MNTIKIMIDSGAYSVWRQGKHIDLNRYIDYLLEYRDAWDTCVNLDVIPGRGVSIDRAAEQSWENYLKMVSAGLNVLPVYHVGERVEWLQRIIDSGANYLGVGGAAKVSEVVRRRFYDALFAAICVKQKPIIKTHAFGMNMTRLLLRYPWTTADSTTWTLRAAYGCIYVPHAKRDGSFDFERTPVMLRMSERTDLNNLKATFDHTSNYPMLGKETRKHVDRWLRGGGFTADEVIKDGDTRRRANVYYYQQVEANHEPRTFKAQQVFDRLTIKHDREPIKERRTRILYVTGSRGDVEKVLKPMKVTRVLMSYAALQKMKSFDLRQYALTGTP